MVSVGIFQQVFQAFGKLVTGNGSALLLQPQPISTTSINRQLFSGSQTNNLLT